MKTFLVILLFAVPSLCFTQSDSLFVETIDGTIQRYAILTIRDVSFTGLLTNVREQERQQSILSSFSLRQNFPNPFNPTTTVQYDIPHAGEVTIAIYDIQGRLIRSLAHLTQAAGTHSVLWDGRGDGGSSLSSGMYVCRVHFDNAILLKKLVLLK